jgi:hypothetical protein
MRPDKALLSLLLALVLGGCASEVEVHELRDAKPGDTVNGIPFRVLKPYRATVYEWTDKGYVEMRTTPVTIPDPNRLFVINFNAQFFANPTFDLQFNSNNTISQVSLKSKSSGATAFSSLGTQISAIGKAKSDAEATVATARSTSADTQIALSNAKLDAKIAEAEYDALKNKPDASTVDLLKAEKTMRAAELSANKAAQAAGKTLPYPDVSP